MKLPADTPARAADGPDVVAEATAACQRVMSMTAEIAVGGSVGDQRVRGHMLAGLARPASLRLEAASPFGAPLFIFVATGDDATLLLPRDDRVLEHGRPDAVLDAIAGVPLDPIDLRAVLTGCGVAADGAEATQPSADWRIVPDGAGHLYVHREPAGWRLTAAVRSPARGEGWRAEYRRFEDGLPREVRLTSTTSKRFDLRLTLSQVETNVALGAEAFRVRIPSGARPITLAELRESGPLSPRAPSAGRPGRQ
ncbi:MAG TPA: hypothetical protein VIW45_13370 [Vicinamibacterales bacterium]|jgi:outer membrane lipoprotein-sorting protein